MDLLVDLEGFDDLLVRVVWRGEREREAEQAASRRAPIGPAGPFLFPSLSASLPLSSPRSLTHPQDLDTLDTTLSPEELAALQVRGRDGSCPWGARSHGAGGAWPALDAANAEGGGGACRERVRLPAPQPTLHTRGALHPASMAFPCLQLP